MVDGPGRRSHSCPCPARPPGRDEDSRQFVSWKRRTEPGTPSPSTVLSQSEAASPRLRPHGFPVSTRRITAHSDRRLDNSIPRRSGLPSRAVSSAALALRGEPLAKLGSPLKVPSANGNCHIDISTYRRGQSRPGGRWSGEAGDHSSIAGGTEEDGRHGGGRWGWSGVEKGEGRVSRTEVGRGKSR